MLVIFKYLKLYHVEERRGLFNIWVKFVNITGTANKEKNSDC